MSNSVDQVFQITRSNGIPAFMTRSLSGIELIQEYNLVIAPSCCECSEIKDLCALMVAIETSSDIQAVLISGAEPLQIHTFAVFNASKNNPFNWLQFVNPNQEESVTVHYMVAGVSA